MYGGNDKDGVNLLYEETGTLTSFKCLPWYITHYSIVPYSAIVHFRLYVLTQKQRSQVVNRTRHTAVELVSCQGDISYEWPSLVHCFSEYLWLDRLAKGSFFDAVQLMTVSRVCLKRVELWPLRQTRCLPYDTVLCICPRISYATNCRYFLNSS